MKRLIALLLALALLAGCTAPEPEAPGLEAVVDTEGVLNLHLGGEPPSIDPVFATSAAGGTYTVQMFEGLVSFDRMLDLQPGVAENWTLSTNSDGLPTYTFTLREGAKWSDGKAVTAQDFVYAWQRAVTPETQASGGYLLYPIHGAREILEGVTTEKADGTSETTYKEPTELGVLAVDEHTLEVTLEGPCPYFLQLLTLPVFFPVREDAVTKAAGWTNDAATCLTNGAYKLKSWDHDQSLTLEKNDQYWDKDHVGPQELHFVFSTDDELVYSDFTRGRLLTATSFPPLEREVTRQNGTLVEMPLLGVYYYSFNTTREFMDTPEVRRALSLAVNRQELAETGIFGRSAAVGLVPYGVPDLNRGWDFRKTGEQYFSVSYATDLSEARELLKEAGYPDGAGLPTLVFLTNDTPGHVEMAELVAATLKENLGVNMEIKALPWNEFVEAREAGEWDIIRSGNISVTRDAYSFLDAFTTDSPQNDAGFSDPIYDEAILESLNSTDEEERNNMLHTIEDYLVMENMVVMPLTFYSQDILVSSNLSGLVYHSAGYIYFRWAKVADSEPEAANG